MTLWLQILAVLLTAGGLAHQKFKNIEKPSVTPDTDYPDNVVENDRAKLINRIEWGFIIGGLMLGIISTLVANHNSTVKEIEDKLATDRQISVATNSLAKLESQSYEMKKQLAYLSHMSGEFDTLTIDATFELVSTNPAALLLTKRVAGIAYSFINMPTNNVDGTNIVTGTFELPHLVGDYGDTRKPRRGEQIPLGSQIDVRGDSIESSEQHGVYSANVVGYMNIQSSVTNSADLAISIRDRIFARFQGGIGTIVEYDKVFSSDWLPGVSSNIDFMKLSDCIQLPMLGVRIFSKHTSGLAAADADFIAPPPTRGTIRPTLGYDSTLRGVLINWRIEYPSSEWQQNVRMGTVQDLDAATLCFYLANIPNFLTNDFKPVMLKLKFGKTTMKVNSFELQSFEKFETGFEPSEPLYPPSELTNFPTEFRKYYADQLKPSKPKSNSAAVFKTILPPPSYDPIEDIVEKSDNHPLEPPPTADGGNTGGVDTSPPKK